MPPKSPAHATVPLLRTSDAPETPSKPPRESGDASAHRQPTSTPLVKKTAGDYPCTSGHIYRDDRVVNMAYEAEDHVLGPMPLENFLDEFMPLPKEQIEDFVSDDTRKRFKKAIRQMESCKKEKDLYPVFIKAVKPLCPNFPPHNTHDTPLPNFDDITIKPDVCFYDKKWVKLGRRGISTVEMMAEFKISLNDDAFIDDSGRVPVDVTYPPPDPTGEETTIHEPSMFLETDFEREEEEEGDKVEEEEEYEAQDEGEEEEELEIVEDPVPFETDITKLTGQGRDTLGQITSYATAQKSAQFRTHFFSMLVFKQHARLLYWDNAGVVVTERFHLTNGLFAEFLGRYNNASMEKRGHDTTAFLLTKAELKVVRDADVFKEDDRLIKLSTKPGSEDHDFYVAKQVTYMGGTSPFGRSTRGFIAYSLSELRKKKKRTEKVFLKDTWRVLGRPQEHTFYHTLHEKEVPYIPSVLRWLDIEGQTTKMQQLCGESLLWAQNAPKDLRGFQHYRLMLKEIGQPLTDFPSTKELVRTVYQALQAHAAAHDAKILHRDISVGNIMWRIDEAGKRSALLVDWDMAKSTDDLTPSARERTGTWQFVAARLLANPAQSLTNTLQDDLESFFYVLTWVTFRYTKNAFNADMLYFHLHTIFDQSYRHEGKLAGGEGKKNFLLNDRILDDAKIENEMLYNLLNSMRAALAILYKKKPGETQVQKTLYTLESQMSISEYETRIEFVKKSQGIIGFFGDTLAQNPWPISDAADEKPVAKPSLTRTLKGASQRMKNIAVEPLDEPAAKRQRTK